MYLNAFNVAVQKRDATLILPTLAHKKDVGHSKSIQVLQQESTATKRIASFSQHWMS